MCPINRLLRCAEMRISNLIVSLYDRSNITYIRALFHSSYGIAKGNDGEIPRDEIEFR